MHVHDMIATHPHGRGSTNDTLIRAIEETFACAQACTACADACISEDMVVELAQCIRLDLDCADICIAAGKIASRRTGSNIDVTLATLQACRLACMACAEECERHARMHKHCAICTEACRRCNGTSLVYTLTASSGLNLAATKINTSGTTISASALRILRR